MTTDNQNQEVKLMIEPEDSPVTANTIHADTENATTSKPTPHTEETKSDNAPPNLQNNPYVVQPASSGVQLQIPPKVRLVPKPFGKIKHVIIASYFSVLCCLITGVYANQYALDAKRYKDLGLRSEAKALAKQSVCCIYASIIIGTLLTLGIGIPVLVVYLTNTKYSTTGL